MYNKHEQLLNLSEKTSHLISPLSRGAIGGVVRIVFHWINVQYRARERRPLPISRRQTRSEVETFGSIGKSRKIVKPLKNFSIFFLIFDSL